jgi:hypothetical protein
VARAAGSQDCAIAKQGATHGIGPPAVSAEKCAVAEIGCLVFDGFGGFCIYPADRSHCGVKDDDTECFHFQSRSRLMPTAVISR